MNIQENLKESMLSIKANKLRSVLTIVTIVIGITCLVGMLTAVEGLRERTLSQYARLGLNSFSIESVRNWRNRRQGIIQKDVPRIEFREAMEFFDRFDRSIGTPGLRAGITGIGKAVRGSKQTDENLRISGVDENYLAVEMIELEIGRNFTREEIESNSPVAIIADQPYSQLYETDENPIDTYATALGIRYKIIGKLKKIGASSTGKDRFFLVPVQEARRKGSSHVEIYVYVNKLINMDEAVGEATGLMRAIRGDKPTDTDSFEIERSTEVEESINSQMNILRSIGFTIGGITLVGACIGLMNIMIVYVRERVREIGVRKTVGATAREIRMQFLTETIFICQLGGVVGILLGLLVGNGTALLLDASFVLPIGPLITGTLVSTLVGVLAGYVPANQAAKVDPIESLRYE